MNVSVVIPNYNGEKFLEKCLSTLKTQTYKDFETFLIDNGSKDQSVNVAKQVLPEIKCIIFDKNYGFSKAVNTGIKNAQGKYVVLLNNDTILTKTWLENLVQCIDGEPNAFSVASKMLQYSSPQKIDNAGDALTFFGWPYQEGHGEDVNLYTTNRAIFTSCAGGAIYRKKCFDEIGYFDENFFAYLEDVDIGYRARIAGYKNFYCSSSILYHIGSATSGTGYNSFKVRLSTQNSILLWYKNMPIAQLIINSPFLLIGYTLKAVFYKKLGFFNEFIVGLKDGINLIVNIKFVKRKKSRIINHFYIQWWLTKKGFVFASRKLIRIVKRRRGN